MLLFKKLTTSTITILNTDLSNYLLHFQRLTVEMAQCDTPQTANSFEVKGQIFDVGPRYYDLNYIGEGAYGMVW